MLNSEHPPPLRLIGDWGVHILGPANWALKLSPESLVSIECIKKDDLPPFTFPNQMVIRYEFAARGNMPPVTVYWYQQEGGDAYLPPGMTPEQARAIPGTGPQIGPARGASTARSGSGSRFRRGPASGPRAARSAASP